MFKEFEETIYFYKRKRFIKKTIIKMNLDDKKKNTYLKYIDLLDEDWISKTYQIVKNSLEYLNNNKQDELLKLIFNLKNIMKNQVRKKWL